MQAIYMQNHSAIDSIRELSFEELDLISGADGVGNVMMGGGAILGGVGAVMVCFPGTAPAGAVVCAVGGILGGVGWIVDQCE